MAYYEKYPLGSIVRVVARPKLDDFYQNWKYHHKLSQDQLAYAGSVAEVIDVGFYHGGDVLYELQGIPGTWHEVCLEGA